MSKITDSISDELKEFIQAQHIFFVGTAMGDGHVNISPKGMDSFRVLGPQRVAWLNLTGSGNETATHIAANPRMTLMFCAFEGKPKILRLYGQAEVHHAGTEGFNKLIGHFQEIAGQRQLFDVRIELIQTSCGFAVPLMDFKKDRTMLKDWAEKKGEKGIQEYWKEKNGTSLDGHTTVLSETRAEDHT